jgi:hypothetical protein
LVGCGIPFSSSAIEGTPEGTFLKQTITQLTTHDFTSIEAALDPAVEKSNIQTGLEQMVALFPAGQPTSIKFLGWSVTTITGKDRQSSVTTEYGYAGNKWLLITAQLRGEPNQFRIWSLHVEPLRESLEQFNAFTFSGKSWLHYFVLLALILALATTLHAFVLCLRTAGLRRKWLWVIFILVGFCAFSLNWTSGEFHVYILHANLFSASVFRNGFAGPWFVTFAIPVGAIMFLRKRRKMTQTAIDQIQPNQSPESTI